MNNLRPPLALTLLFTLGCLGIGCAHTQVKRDVVIEKSQNQSPAWTMKQAYERDDYLFVVGEGLDNESYALASRKAKLAAVQNLVETVSLRARSEITRSAQKIGLAPTSEFLQDSVAMTSELVTVQNLTHDEDYRDKTELAENGSIRYRVCSLYKFPLAEFKAAKIRALESISGRATKKQVADTAKKLLEEVKSE